MSFMVHGMYHRDRRTARAFSRQFGRESLISIGMAIYSETAKLRRVLVHRPGTEVEQMTPSRATELLYNEIIPVEAVQREHDRLRRVLETTAETIELVDVLTSLAAESDGPSRIARELSFGDPRIADALTRRWDSVSPKHIVDECVRGVPADYDRLQRYLHGPRFLTPPLPNLYFMRDASFVVHERAYRSSMASSVRRAETALVSLALEQLHVPVDRGYTEPIGGAIEGGDVLVYSEDLLLVGVGPRTTASAVDALVTAVAAQRETQLTVLAVLLPDSRATIHLDMVVTILEPGRALVYMPIFEGPKAAPVHRLRVPPGTHKGLRWKIDDFADLPGALNGCGVEVDRIPCGGTDPIVQEREQWFSACNSVALSPGQIVVFGNNRATLDSLAGAGYELREDPPSSGRSGSFSTIGTEGGRIAWAIDGLELARGGGGPRCMTLPIDRDNTE